MICSVLTTQQVYAQGELTTRLDERTLQQGITLQSIDNLFHVSIPPAALSTPVAVTVSKKYDIEKAPAEVPAVITHTFASDVYVYDFPGITASTIKQDLTLRITPKISNIGIKVAFYDRNAHTWRFLPSVTMNDGSVTAKIRLPFSYVALFAPKQEMSGVADMLRGIQAGLAVDETGSVIYEKNPETVLPVASLTKLMTALVFLEHNPGWQTNLEILPIDDADPAKVAFRKGDIATVKDLFYVTLIGSANNTAKAIARSTGLSDTVFVELMNKKARALGMTHTTFTDPTGLNPRNQSTPGDYMKLVRVAFQQPDIMRATATKSYVLHILNTKRETTIRTTNKLARDENFVSYAKTGFIDEAGYNFAVRALCQGKEMTIVLLGSYTSNARFDAARRIIEKKLLPRENTKNILTKK